MVFLYITNAKFITDRHLLIFKGRHWESKLYTTIERRNKPRVACDYPAIVKGSDLQENMYEENGQLANLSRGGLYMLVNRYFEYNAKLSVTIHLAGAPIDEDIPKLATKGIVVRTEQKTNGTYGVAIKFEQYRFL
jgi:hypothetical protein